MPKLDTRLVGTWSHPDDDSSVEYSILIIASSYAISAIDSADGEVLEISEVSWDGRGLRFRSRTPSTNWVVEHEFRPTGDTTVEHRHSFSETWTRREGE